MFWGILIPMLWGWIPSMESEDRRLSLGIHVWFWSKQTNALKHSYSSRHIADKKDAKSFTADLIGEWHLSAFFLQLNLLSFGSLIPPWTDIFLDASV